MRRQVTREDIRRLESARNDARFTKSRAEDALLLASEAFDRAEKELSEAVHEYARLERLETKVAELAARIDSLTKPAAPNTTKPTADAPAQLSPAVGGMLKEGRA